MRAAVIGAGAVGTLVAANLAANGHDVVMCARRRFAEYRVDSPQRPVSGPAHVASDPSELAGEFPWVLLAVKAHQTEAARGWLDRLAGPATTIVALQNGIESVETVQTVAPKARVLQAVLRFAVELVADGHVRHDAGDEIVVADTEPGRQFAETFAGPGASVIVEADFTTQLWVKLAANVAVNGLMGLTGRDSEVLFEPGAADIARTLVEECWTVGRTAGATVDPQTAAQFVAALADRPRYGTSMLYDRRAGRPLEHDALYGAVIRAAVTAGIDVPVTRTIGALLAAIQDLVTNSAGEVDRQYLINRRPSRSGGHERQDPAGPFCAARRTRRGRAVALL